MAIAYKRKLSPVEAKYWRFWRLYCLSQGVKQSDQVARHALHCEALGYDKSHKHFSNREYDLVYFAMIWRINGMDPHEEHLEMAEEEGERRRLVFRILQEAPEAYARKIAQGKFRAATDWQNLPLKQLEQLRITVIERARAAHRKGRDLYSTHRPSPPSPFKP